MNMGQGQVDQCLVKPGGSLSASSVARLERCLAGGMGSGGRYDHRDLFLKSGRGSRVVDADGHEYVDYMMGFGALILGHAHPSIMEAIQTQLSLGTMFGAACDSELQLAEKVTELLPCADLVRFTSSGTEAVQAAIRLARAKTGRQKFLKFEGHFHGWADTQYISVKSQSPVGSVDCASPLKMTHGQPDSVLGDVVVAKWNDIEALTRSFDEHGRDLACVILEPYPTNNGCMEAEDGYLNLLKNLCHVNGVLLIFDEVVSGFRMDVGGAQSLYQVTPDLCTFGKALAGGMPIAGFAGRGEIMDLLAKNKVAHLGTYNSNAISAAAALSTLAILEADNGEVLQSIQDYGCRLRDDMNSLFQDFDAPFCAAGHGSVLSIFSAHEPPHHYRDTLTHDAKMLSHLHRCLLAKGIWTFGRGNLMVSSAHSDEDREVTLDILKSVLSELPAIGKENRDD